MEIAVWQTPVDVGTWGYWLQLAIECYSIECRKTKTKVRATVNHSMETITTSQSEERKLPSRTNKKSEYKQPTTKTRENAGKRGKTRVTKAWLVLVLHLIGGKGGASFLDQSQGEIKQKQSNLQLLTTYYLKLLYFHCAFPFRCLCSFFSGFNFTTVSQAQMLSTTCLWFSSISRSQRCLRWFVESWIKMFPTLYWLQILLCTKQDRRARFRSVEYSFFFKCSCNRTIPRITKI